MEKDYKIPGKKILDAVIAGGLLLVLAMTAVSGVRYYPFYRFFFHDHAAARAAAFHFIPLALLVLCRWLLGGRGMLPLICQLAAQGMCTVMYLLRDILSAVWLRYAVPPLLLLFLPAAAFSLLGAWLPHRDRWERWGRMAANALLFVLVLLFFVLALTDTLLFGVLLRLMLPVAFLPLAGVLICDAPWYLKLLATVMALTAVIAVVPGGHRDAVSLVLCLLSGIFLAILLFVFVKSIAKRRRL